MKITDPKLTYCNPLSIPQIPRGLDDYYDECYQNSEDMLDPPLELTNGTPDYRSISDPTVFYYDNKWYLYPSYGMAWVSEDFRTWKHIRTSPYCAKYSPSIIPWKGRFLLTGWNCPLYVGDTPTGPFEKLGDLIRPDGTHFLPLDPGIFLDDDGRIYIYEVGIQPKKGLRVGTTQIVGYELDRDDPRKVVRGPAVVLEMDPANYTFERYGQYNQDHRFGWVEGPHMIKHNSRYYLIYGTSSTQYASYVQAVAYSDEDPLAPMQRQIRNPLTANNRGLVQGPGHGCVEHGPNNSLWAFYTVTTPYVHKFERRIGMDRVLIDENGEMYCPNGVTSMPQYAPGVEDESATPGLLPLTAWCRPTASSCAPGRDAIYGTDESCLTWWQPADDDAEPTLTCVLDTNFHVTSSRVYWRDVGIDYAKGILPGPFRYCIEGLHDDQWVMLLDRRDSQEDLNCDYRTFDAVQCTQVRLKITGWPEGIKPGVIDFTVFGVCPDLE